MNNIVVSSMNPLVRFYFLISFLISFIFFILLPPHDTDRLLFGILGSFFSLYFILPLKKSYIDSFRRELVTISGIGPFHKKKTIISLNGLTSITLGPTRINVSDDVEHKGQKHFSVSVFAVGPQLNINLKMFSCSYSDTISHAAKELAQEIASALNVKLVCQE